MKKQNILTYGFLIMTLMLLFSMDVKSKSKIFQSEFICNDTKESNLNTENIIKTLERVANWQIANQRNTKRHDLSWINATLYIGLMDLSKISEEIKYRELLLNIGWKYQWQPLYRMYMADDIAVSQMYLDMYRTGGDERMFNPTQARTEWIINHPSISNFKYGNELLTKERWSWCDALFMAPPVYAQMYNITKDVKYLEFMDREYRMTYDLLYDKQEKLFYRDHNYFDKRENNGQKIFWGRGNGWVLGGLVRILKELPETSQSRIFYAQLFAEMCERITTLQDEHGYWHASMLDIETYSNPETSSSSFFVYALAYGINSGLLDREKYLPVALKGWKALEEAVSPEGKLEWVQQVGGNPQFIKKEMTETYGVGAFLMAGTEIYRLSERANK